MTTGLPPKTQLKWQGLVGLLGVFAGFCTLFALVVTVGEGWQEHVRAQWPEVTARIQRCGLNQTSTRRRDRYYIDCRLSYIAGDHEFVAKVYSRSVPSRAIWQYPPNQIGPLEDWVNKHPQGTSITVHYDPGDPKKAVLVETDMPGGGPHTPSNLKLLGIAAVTCLILLTIARVTRPRSDPVRADVRT